MVKATRGKAIGNLAAAIFAVSLMSGCYQRVGLYPVRSSSAAQVPGSVPVMKITGAFTTGTATVRMSDGEVCKGKWKQVQTRPDNSMATVWDEIYGQGYYVAHVLGQRIYAEAVLTGDRGTTLTVQMYKHYRGDLDEVSPPILGVAKDNRGNIYKVAS